MADKEYCDCHKDHESRISRSESDIQAIFKKFESSSKSAWAFFATAGLALAGMLFQFFMSLGGK